MTFQRLTHLGICVADLSRSLAFWRDGLGFRELGTLKVAGPEAARLLEIDGLKLHAVYLERDGVRIELLHYPEPGVSGDGQPVPMNRLGFTHLSLRVEDLDAAIGALAQVGGRVLAATRIDNPEFGAHAVFVTDPDGTRVELIQSPGDPTALPPGAERGES